MESSQDNAPIPAFVDVPYVPPNTTDGTKIAAQSGYVGGLQVTPDGVQAGQGDGQVKYINDPHNERIVVGDPADPNVIVGQLISKSGVDEYGIWCATGYFTGTVNAALGNIGGWVIGPNTLSSSTLILDSSNENIRSSDYVADVSGFLISSTLIEAQNLKARGILKGATFQYDVISAVGGQLMVSNADVLAVDMTAADNSTLTITGASTFSLNDILIFRGVVGGTIEEEWLRVTDVTSAPTYTVTRDLAGTYAANNNPIWTKGVPVVKQGKSDGGSTFSGGWLRLFGEGANSPYYSVFARTGVAYNAYSERVRLGNLNGIGPFVTDTYGIFIGDYATKKYLSYDEGTGNLDIGGYLPTSKGSFGGDGSDGALAINSGTTIIDLANAAVVVKNYTSISITGTGKLAFINPNTSGTVLILKSQGAVTLTSSATPLIDFSGMGGAGGAQSSNPNSGNNGTTAADILGNDASQGVKGLHGSNTTPTNGGAAYTNKVFYPLTSSRLYRKYLAITAGSGGASGGTGVYGNNPPGVGGKGGDGGGGLIIQCAGSLNFTGTISVAGLPGSNAGLSASISTGSGGGGGGAGGMCVVLYNSSTAVSGTINVNGGNGGNGGAVAGGSGNPGGQGGGGGGMYNGAGGAGGAGGASPGVSAGNGSSGSNSLSSGAGAGSGGTGGGVQGGGGGGGGTAGEYLIAQNRVFA